MQVADLEACQLSWPVLSANNPYLGRVRFESRQATRRFPQQSVDARPPNFAADDSALIAADAKGRPLSISQRAEELLRAGDGLLVKDGVLTAQAADTAANAPAGRFVRAIDPTFDNLPGRGVRISRNSGKSDLLVVVSRFPPSLEPSSEPDPMHCSSGSSNSRCGRSI